MNILSEILNNKAITIPVLSWFTAQTLKVAGVVLSERKLDFTRFVGSGGMPSSHTSFIVCLATVTGKNNGWDSGIFAVSVAVALIVMYDAAGIRRAAGKQAEVLNKLVFSSDHKLHIDEELKELLGHTPLQVLMGALLGTGFGLYFG